MTEYNNYYIVGLYMAFTSNGIHEIYTKYKRSKQDHDSYQQLSYTTYDLHHKHMSAAFRPTTCICPTSVRNICQCKYHQTMTKYAAYRYQLVLLISSRSTCSVFFVERALSYYLP